MSLNGLDATVVNEAYQAALIEGGGWFALNTILPSKRWPMTCRTGFYSITRHETR